MGPNSTTQSVDRLIGTFLDFAVSDSADRGAVERQGGSCSESVDHPVIDFFDDEAEGMTREGP